jgi:hypothetical protein
MKRIVRLTESDLTRIVRRVINEQGQTKYTNPKPNPNFNVIDFNVGAVRYSFHCTGQPSRITKQGKMDPNTKTYPAVGVDAGSIGLTENDIQGLFGLCRTNKFPIRF